MPEAAAPVLRCKDHPEALAVARCSSCSRALCSTCFVFTMGERPACARCAYETATRPQRRFSLAVVFLCFVAGMGFWVTRRYDMWPAQAGSLAFGGIVALVVTGVILASARSASKLEVVRRDPDGDDAPVESAFEGSANPYRAGARRVILAVSPRVSGKVTALVVAVSLVAAGVLVPFSVRLPRWIEAEMVLALWWLVLLSTLVVLLYRGFRLKDDLVYFVPWGRPAPLSEKGQGKKARGGTSSLGDGCGTTVNPLDGCSADGEGALVAIVVVVALVVALGAAWLMVEIAMPLVFFLMYTLLMRAIRRAASDRRGCEGDFVKSLGSGALWATIYVLPLALLTWAVHAARH